MHFVNNIIFLSLTGVAASPALRGRISNDNPKVQGTIASAALTIGTDHDSHNCVIAAGFRYCASKSRCIQPFAEGIGSESVFERVCNGKVGGHSDDQGCFTQAGYHWCAATRECVRPWEHGIYDDSSFDRICSIAAGSRPDAVITTA